MKPVPEGGAREWLEANRRFCDERVVIDDREDETDLVEVLEAYASYKLSSVAEKAAREEELHEEALRIFDKRIAPTLRPKIPNEFWEFAAKFAGGFGEPTESWNTGGFIGGLKDAWERGGPMPHAKECNCVHCPDMEKE